MMLARNDLADYIADHYGECIALHCCPCLRDGWRGRACPNWNPVAASNWEELREAMRGAVGTEQ
jgi:hypothetical protein